MICFSPEDDSRLVKRIVGVPGDRIEMRNSAVFLNGRRLAYGQIDPEYAEGLPSRLKDNSILATEDLDGTTHAVMSTPSVRAIRNFGPVTVPQDNYFVMGDNRDCSKDSRYFGFVERKAIVGKAKGVILSFDITDKYQPRFKRFFAPVD